MHTTKIMDDARITTYSHRSNAKKRVQSIVENTVIAVIFTGAFLAMGSNIGDYFNITNSLIEATGQFISTLTK